MLIIKWIIGFVLVAMALGVVVLNMTGGASDTAGLYSNVAQITAAAVAGLIFLITAFAYYKRKNSIARTYFLLGLGALLWAIGNTAYLMAYLSTGVEPAFPHYSLWFFIGMYLFFIVGLLLYKNSLEIEAEGLSLAVSTGVFILFFILSIYTSDTLASIDSSVFFTNILWAVLDSVIIAVVVLLLMSLGMQKPHWWLIALGMTMYVLTARWVVLLLTKGQYESGSWFDMFFIMGFALIAIGGLVAHTVQVKNAVIEKKTA